MRGGPANVLLMLRYLDRLITSDAWEFEEVDYYERLFLRLVDEAEDRKDRTTWTDVAAFIASITLVHEAHHS